MKYRYIIPFILILFLAGCTSANKIFEQEDHIKEQSTIKLKQSLKGYSDENKKGTVYRDTYWVSTKYFHASLFNGNETDLIEVRMRTRVRAHELEPNLYISLDEEVIKLTSDEYITKLYQQSSNSTSSESTTTVSESENSEESSDESGDTEISTTTSYSTTTDHDTYQLMHLSFTVEKDLWAKLCDTENISYRLYLGNESIDIRLKGRDKRKLKDFALKSMG